MIRDLDTLLGATEPDLPFALDLSTEELIRVAFDRLGEKGDLVDDLAVELDETRLSVGGMVGIFGMPVRVLCQGLPRAEDGGIVFDIHQVDINGNPAPGFMRQRLNASINKRLTPDALPVFVETLTLMVGGMAISGRTKGAFQAS